MAADLSGRRASRSRPPKAGSARGGDACGTVGREYGNVCEAGLDGVGGGTAGCSIDACGCSAVSSAAASLSEGEEAASSHESATSSGLGLGDGLGFGAGIWRSDMLSGGSGGDVSGCN